MTTQTQNQTPSTTETIWQLDPAHTNIAFSAKHMMVSTVRGKFQQASGALHYDEANPLNSWVEVEIDAESLITSQDQRDAHLRSADFLHAEEHPKLHFKSTKVEPKGDNEFRVTGDLTIRGVTHPVTLDAEVSTPVMGLYGKRLIGVSATTKINREEWGLTWNVAIEAGGVLVSKDIKIEVDAEFLEATGA
jgi:polyisoprenoid-binding protein YceI